MTKEITDNDYRALELLREKLRLQEEIDAIGKAHIDDILSAMPGSILFKKMDNEGPNRDRIERIDFALEAWAKGEDILVAMLADPRENNEPSTFELHHAVWQQRALNAQSLGAIKNTSHAQTLAQNAINALQAAAQHFGKQVK